MIAKKMSPKYAELTVHTRELLLILNALDKLEESTITKHFGKELDKIRETLRLTAEEMVM